MWKPYEIRPVAKKPNPVALNSYRPVLVISLAVKCLNENT